jgi:hypothetical protein
MPEAELDAAIQQAIDAHRNNRAHPATQQDQTSQLWASAMLDSLQKLGVPVQPVPNG